MIGYQNTRKKILNITGLICGSISAQVISLMGQLNDFEFLNVSEKQLERLDKIEQELHKLVNEITNDK